MRTLAFLSGVLLLAGCGGAKSASTSSTPTTSLTIPPITTTRQTTGTKTTVTLTQTTTATKTTATKTTAVNARVPATFTVKPGGSVSPPTITVPAQFTVQLTVISGDGRPHRAVLHGRSLAVPAHGHASTLIRGLPAGSYPLQVDGARKGALTIGGSPGP